MHIFTKALNRFLLVSFATGFCFTLKAQEKDSSLVDTLVVSAKAKSVGPKVAGTIIDSSTGKALSGINISIPGFSSTFTDEKGNFKISIPTLNAVLIINGEGYQTKQVALKGKKSITVALYEDTYKSFYDNVRLPYSVQSKNIIPYSISAITTEGNWNKKAEAADSYLQGSVAGLNAIRRSGTPGMGANLFLRGFNSLNATNQPLVVVDGMIYDINEYSASSIAGFQNNPLNLIDIKDIDNITVIKDGASMYGTKGANGVILITTARAQQTTTKIDFAAYGGFNFKSKNIPVLKSGDYRLYLSEILKSGGMSDDAIDALPFTNDGEVPAYSKNTSWQNEVLSGAYNQNYYLKVTGGDNIATYGLSVGYLDSKGVVSNTNMQRYQTRFNGDLNLSTRLKATVNLSFVNTEQALKDQGLNIRTNPLFLALVKAPFLPVNEVAEDGSVSPNLADKDIFGISNPSVVINESQALNKTYRFFGSAGFNYNLAKNLTLQTLLGVTFDKSRETFFNPAKGISNDTLSTAIVKNNSGSSVSRLFSLYNDTRLSYMKALNSKNQVTANIGARFNESKTELDYGLGFNSATDELISVGKGASALKQIGGRLGEWRWLNAYLNADYKHADKYFLSFNMGIDGSSRFGREASGALKFNGNRYAVLPSIAGAWLISSENFMNLSDKVEMLKLRLSYGFTGNDDIGNYSSKHYYVSQNLLGMQGLVRGNIGNPQLKWETVEKANAGLDIALFKERLNFSIDVYSNRTHNMLVDESVSVIGGVKTVWTNNGGMQTNGFDVEIGGRLVNKAFKWDMFLNVGRYKNEITKIPNDRMVSEYAGAYILTEKGRSANLFYGYKTNDIYSTREEASSAGLQYRLANGSLAGFQAGDVRFVNTYGADGIIDEKDMQVIGDPNPDFTGMFGHKLKWKQWNLDAMFTFSSGNDVYNRTRAALESMSGVYNQTEFVLNRWRYEGQATNVPRAAFGDPAGNARFSDRWIEDGSYIRLRTLSLSYSVPLKTKFLKYATVYATANNVFTLTKYLGYDPEFSATNSVIGQGIDIGLEPQFKSTQLGVRIGL